MQLLESRFDDGGEVPVVEQRNARVLLVCYLLQIRDAGQTISSLSQAGGWIYLEEGGDKRL